MKKHQKSISINSTLHPRADWRESIAPDDNALDEMLKDWLELGD